MGCISLAKESIRRKIVEALSKRGMEGKELLRSLTQLFDAIDSRYEHAQATRDVVQPLVNNCKDRFDCLYDSYQLCVDKCRLSGGTLIQILHNIARGMEYLHNL